MEVNQEDKHPDVRDVGKEIDQGLSNDDDAITTLDKFLRDPEIFRSILSTPTMQTHLQKEKETDQGPDDSPKTPQQETPPKDADHISTLDEFLRSPEILKGVISTPTMQRYLSPGLLTPPDQLRSVSLTPTPTIVRVPSYLNPITLQQANLVTKSTPFKQDLRDRIESLGRLYLAKSAPSKPEYSTSSDDAIYPTSRLSSCFMIPETYSTPDSSTSESSTPESSTPESSTPRCSTPESHTQYSTPVDFQICSSTTTTPCISDDEGKQIEEQNRYRNLEENLQRKVEYLIYALKEEIPPEVPKHLYPRQERLKLKKEFAKQAQRRRRELAKVWKELIILKQKSEQKLVDERWSISEEVENLFNVALKFSYPEFEDEEPSVLACIEEDNGDFQCENVLSIWPKLRKKATMHLGPRRVGRQIKMNLQLLRPQMIESAPRVLGVGFVTIKLSGKWMAESIHKMLRDGIGTWAPKLLMESVKVNFPSCDMADLVPMDLLRRELIKETSISMLKYCKIDVEFSKPCEIALPKEENDKFRMEEKDGDVLIFRNCGGEQEPLIHAKRDGWSGINPMDDLADLWYGLRGEKADWIVCVTPVQQQEYLKMCIKAAQHAGWLPLHIRDSPRASYTGFQILNTKLKHENLSSLLDKAKSSCEAAAVVLGYTGEQVSNCALKYTILKNNRLADYTFNSQEMLDAEGNTFVYLLNTQFRIRSFTDGSSEAIDKLKKDSKLKLGKGKIWKEGVERVLVKHLLKFSEVILAACLPVLPHILCEYVYDLSKNFNSVCEVGFVETTKLLLCEATRVVMEKCFQLLGITPKSSSLGEGLPQASSLLLTQRLNHKDDPPKINTRFELFSVYPYITRDRDVTEAMMFGQIGISDGYSALWDEWGLTDAPDHGFVGLFDHDWSNPVDITNGRPFYLGDPSSRQLVPFSSAMETCVELYAFTEWNDAVFELGSCCLDTDLQDFLEEEADTKRCLWISKGQDGCVRMYYILLKNAVDSAVKVRYNSTKDSGGEVFAEIVAYYGSDFFKNVDHFEKKFYSATLLRNRFDPNIPEIPLERSMMAVPLGGSIVIEVILWDVNSWDVILRGRCEFLVGSGGVETIPGSCGSLEVSVHWSRVE